MEFSDYIHEDMKNFEILSEQAMKMIATFKEKLQEAKDSVAYTTR